MPRGSGYDKRKRSESNNNIYNCRDVETENLDDMVTLADKLKSERETVVEQTE